MSNNAAAAAALAAGAVDPLAPFPRRSTKHEWSESILSAIEEQQAAIIAAAAGNNATNTASNNAANTTSKSGGGNNNKPGTANSNQGKRGGGNKGSHGHGDSDNAGTMSPEQLAAAAYVPIRRHVTNACLVPLFNDKRIVLLGGASGGESLNQVAEYDVATKQWSHGLSMPDKRSEATAVVCYVCPPPLPKADGEDGSGSSVLLADNFAGSTGGKASKSMIGGASPMGGGGKGDKNAPSADALAALAASSPQQLIVMFGGWDDNKVVNDTFFWLVSGVCPQTQEQKTQGKWWRLPSSSSNPSARRGHSMVSMVDTSSLIQQSLPSTAAVAGGALQPGTIAAHTTYSQIRYNTAVYVFGGFDGTRRLNDLWQLDVPFNTCCPASPTPATNVAADNMSWRKISAAGFPPTPRDGAALAADTNNNNRRLFLCGGFSTHRENDCYTFDIDTAIWTKLSIAPSPPCRYGSLAAISGNFAVVGLGQDARGPSNAMFQLLMPPNSNNNENNNNNNLAEDNNNNSPLSNQNAGVDADNQQTAAQYAAKWSLCPLENSVLLDAKQTKGSKSNKDDDLANQTPELDPESRLDFCYSLTPEIGPILTQLQSIPDQSGAGGNKKGGGVSKSGGAGSGSDMASNAPDSARGGGGGNSNNSEHHQKRTLWIFGGANNKSQYHTSLIEIEMDRPEVQTKAGKK